MSASGESHWETTVESLRVRQAVDFDASEASVSASHYTIAPQRPPHPRSGTQRGVSGRMLAVDATARNSDWCPVSLASPPCLSRLLAPLYSYWGAQQCQYTVHFQYTAHCVLLRRGLGCSPALAQPAFSTETEGGREGASEWWRERGKTEGGSERATEGEEKEREEKERGRERERKRKREEEKERRGTEREGEGEREREKEGEGEGEGEREGRLEALKGGRGERGTHEDTHAHTSALQRRRVRRVREHDLYNLVLLLRLQLT